MATPTVGQPQEIKEVASTGRTPAVIWSGHFTDYSGYAKANREILFRTANVLDIKLLLTGLEEGLVKIDPYTLRRVDVFRNTRVPVGSPLLRFFGPDYVPKESGHRICWTMMETYKIHHQMVGMINQGYDELWIPTDWSRKVFEESGVKIPTRTMPLGVDSRIYRPIKGARLPECRLVTGPRAGAIGVPAGFVFLAVGLPSFRKGFDVIAEAFVNAFEGQGDVHLVFGVTHSLPEWNRELYQQFAGRRAMIWTLEGRYNEHEMAGIYSASNCYVGASRGEGWNLPACEAAACGLPVIAPNNTSHQDVLQDTAWFFEPEGVSIHPEGKRVSAWYEGMPFSVMGSRSAVKLAELMKFVSEDSADVRKKAMAGQALMRNKWTWENASNQVIERLLEVQP